MRAAPLPSCSYALAVSSGEPIQVFDTPERLARAVVERLGATSPGVGVGSSDVRGLGTEPTLFVRRLGEDASAAMVLGLEHNRERLAKLLDAAVQLGAGA